MKLIDEIDKAIEVAELEECCAEHGRPVSHRDFFFGRVRRFRVVCPQGHVRSVRVWAPPGKKWGSR